MGRISPQAVSGFFYVFIVVLDPLTWLLATWLSGAAPVDRKTVPNFFLNP
jgi:hypothetical protein